MGTKTIQGFLNTKNILRVFAATVLILNTGFTSIANAAYVHSLNENSQQPSEAKAEESAKKAAKFSDKPRGGEKKLFIMEKSYNSQNLLVINTNTDDNCNIVTQNGQLLDFYWLMDGKTRKRVHPLIRSGIDKRVEFVKMDREKNEFKVRMNELKELKHDLKNIELEVSSELIDGECQTKAVLPLGPSANFKKMILTRSYCDVSTNFVGVPNGCNFLELEGTDTATGEPLKVRFNK